MRILLTSDAIGGVWRFGVELARELDRQGHEVVMACLGAVPSRSERAEIDALDRVVLHARPYRLEWMTRPWADVAAAGHWLEELADISGCDLAHFNSYGQLARGFGLPTVLTLHSCVQSWWRAVYGTAAGPSWGQYSRCVAEALAAADHVVAPTRAILNAVLASYPQARLRGTSVIHNGLDARSWPPPPAGSRRDLVLGVGRVWDRSKNLEAVIRATENLACEVVIAGAGAAAAAGGAAPAGRVSLIERASRARLSGYYRRASVFAHPALYEPFGLAVLEAALSGCALVLGDIATLRELWGPVAIFVDPLDEDALQRELASLLEDPAAAAAHGQRARQHALRYSAKAMAHDYLALYDSLLERAPTMGIV